MRRDLENFYGKPAPLSPPPDMSARDERRRFFQSLPVDKAKVYLRVFSEQWNKNGQDDAKAHEKARAVVEKIE